MNTKRVEIKIYTEHLYCECGGEIKQEPKVIDEYGYCVDISVSVWPPIYYHVCDKCGKRDGLYETYPRLVYEEVKEY